MFRYEIESPPFGRLWKQGKHTKVWSGRIELSAFEGAFDIVLRASAEGPLPQQSAAMVRLAAECSLIRDRASTGMIEVYRQSALDPGAIRDAARVWDLVEPAFVEVCDESYYGDGRICILVAFASRLESDFLPAIETADGHFVVVLSGT